ncbi:hypothetical protein REJ49_004593 [Citrobacter farmeri]|nr:hypothetical protein [Citrobacter farmeri]
MREGGWKYRYRAVDTVQNALDFLLIFRRDTTVVFLSPDYFSAWQAEDSDQSRFRSCSRVCSHEYKRGGDGECQCGSRGRYRQYVFQVSLR